jgi:hypothetical protein
VLLPPNDVADPSVDAWPKPGVDGFLNAEVDDAPKLDDRPKAVPLLDDAAV